MLCVCRLYVHIRRGQNKAKIKFYIIFLFRVTTENFRLYIKVRAALHIQARITRDKLYGVYGDEAPSLRTVERWGMLFHEGREEVEGEARPGRLITQTTSENIEKAHLLINDDPYSTIEEVQEQSGLNYGSIHRIITDYLNLKKISARYVPK